MGKKKRAAGPTFWKVSVCESLHTYRPGEKIVKPRALRQLCSRARLAFKQPAKQALRDPVARRLTAAIARTESP